MSTFDAIGIAATGATVHRKWLDAISDNIANMNDAVSTTSSAFQQRYVIAQPASDGNGVQVGGIVYGSAAGRIVYDPQSPLADAQGNVRYPDIDLGDQMGQLIMAQRGYQAQLMIIPPIGPIASVTTMPKVGQPTGAGSGDFASTLAGGLDQLQALQTKSDDLAVQSATGSLTDVHDYMIASTEASLATQLTVAVRNKAVEAFNDIMRMQA
jgi:flagellar basal-body rod protein FlgC